MLLLGIEALDRIRIQYGKKSIVVAIDISETNGIKPGTIGLFKEALEELKIKKQTTLKISTTTIPQSVEIIRKKLDGKELTKKEIDTIIKDLSGNELTEIELTYFVSACYQKNLNFKEIIYLTEAITKYGNKINVNRKIVADKHCIGGIPNNRTSMLIVPIITAAGLTMIKTSSRSITSPAGTADTMESLSEVDFSAKRIKEIVKKINGCIVWGGSINIAEADEKLIKIRYPLRLDPIGLMLASILAKKSAVNSTHLLIDIPVGKTAKVKTQKEARSLKNLFEKLGKQLKIITKVIITNGSQPIGNGIGPNLEARDILHILRKDPLAPKDLEKKSVYMADLIFQMTNTKASAQEILDSGKAYQQFMKIIKAQNGNPKITPEELIIRKHAYEVKAKKSGKIKEIDNKILAKIARIAGAPNDKGSGIYLHKKLNQKVKKNDILFTIYAKNKKNLKYAKNFIKDSVIVE